MKLYSHPVSQHARRVRMLCHELGLAPEIVNVAMDKGENRSEEFLNLNAAGQVPVLVDGDRVLPESHAIMKYLALTKGSGRFYPVEHQPEIDRWLDWTHATLNPPVQTIAIETFVNRENADQNVIAAAHDRVKSALTGYEKGYSLEPVTIADFAVVSTLALYQMVGGSFDAYPRVRRRYDLIAKRPGFAATAPEF